MTRAYDLDDDRSRHPLGDGWLVAWAILVAIGARFGLAVASVGTMTVALVGRRVGFAAVGAVLAVVSSALGALAWASAVPRQLGPFEGWATVSADPVTVGRGTRLTLEVEGERFDAWLYGATAGRALQRQAGEVVFVAGARRSTRSARVRPSAPRRGSFPTRRDGRRAAGLAVGACRQPCAQRAPPVGVCRDGAC
jgi:hypothetical protein